MPDLSWKYVTVIDEEYDEVGDIKNICRVNYGEGRAPSCNSGEYRRSNRFNEDGYGELDFA